MPEQDGSNHLYLPKQEPVRRKSHMPLLQKSLHDLHVLKILLQTLYCELTMYCTKTSALVNIKRCSKNRKSVSFITNIITSVIN